MPLLELISKHIINNKHTINLELSNRLPDTSYHFPYQFVGLNVSFRIRLTIEGPQAK